ncbi:SDR family NAD(P)-dependent oxidoreductase, partial [Streptomyces boncukensis]
HHTLRHNATADVRDDGLEPPVIAALTGKRPDTAALTHALARLHTAGVDVDWAALLGSGGRAPRTVALPTYAFQHQRFWPAPASAPPASGGEGHDPAEARLWQAVEALDVEALTHTLQLDDGEAVDTLRPALPILASWRRRHREQAALDSWRYRIDWRALPEAGAAAPTGTWLLLVPAGHDGAPAVRTAVRALREHGAEARIRTVEAAGADRGLLARLCAPEAGEAAPDGVISLLALDESPLPGLPAVAAGLAATAAAVQALADAGGDGPLWCLTQHAVAVSPGDPAPSPVQAQTWGLGRVAALEHPRLWGGLVDLPASPDHRTPARLAALLATGRTQEREDQVAIRASGTLARRLRAAPPPRTDREPWRPEGTTLITGGTGELGSRVARYLAGHGAPHLLLTSRSGPEAPGAAALARELTELGTTVTITACDVSDRTALQHLLETIPAQHPLTTVIHAAGTADTTP